jgi:rhodanese-related sulfurtransferase
MSAKYKTKKILIKRSYQFLALILLLLAVGLVLIPKHAKHEGIRPELFVKNILSGERFISTDELAERMISQDPSLILIDTRTEDAYNKFTLPNAMNLPLADVFNEELNYYLDQEIYDVVLFSNDNFLADEVWMLGNRMGYQRLYVLQGGLNEWFNTIIHPQVPKQTKSQDAFDLY